MGVLRSENDVKLSFLCLTGSQKPKERPFPTAHRPALAEHTPQLLGFQGWGLITLQSHSHILSCPREAQQIDLGMGVAHGCKRSVVGPSKEGVQPCKLFD